MSRIRKKPIKPKKGKKFGKAKPNSSSSSSSCVSIEDIFQIVPWSSSDEWDKACRSFHDKDYKNLISEILIWQKRVPSLPMGVEATLFILEAICYDDLRFVPNSSHSDDQARSLYSLALVRYLNHVGHIATFSIGETSTAPTRDLALSVGTPDWLVSLRNEVSHGTTTPSTESLRVSGDFIVEWLKEKYWIHPEFSHLETNANDILTTSNSSDEADASLISQVLSAFIAARIYSFREIHVIEDTEITKHLRDTPLKAKTKTVIVALKPKLADFLSNKSNIMCSVIAQEMIPSSDFYEDFKGLFVNTKFNPFEQLLLVWLPIIKMLERKGKILSVCLQLVELHVSPETESSRELSALWIDQLLQMLEETGKNHSPKLQNLLRTVMINPNSHSKQFLPRLLSMVQNKLGEDKIRKLEALASVWIDDSLETSKVSKKAISLKDGDYFTIQHIIPPGTEANSPIENFSNSRVKWGLDSRDSDKFWNRKPIGAVFQV